MFERVKAYLMVTKPGIILGNLIAATGGFLLAARGDIDMTLLWSTLLGLSLVIASSCILNNTIDRHTDKKMARTQNRALVTGHLSPEGAVLFATVLGILGVTLICVMTNPLCVVMVLAGFTVYVGLYSLYLKANTIYSTLIGSLAGTAPPLVGYCAVTNRFDTGAVLLLIMFVLWQMPHCYAIAVFRYKEYRAAGIPVLPIKKGLQETKRAITAFMLAFFGASLMFTFQGYTGYRYLIVACAVNLFWLYTAWSGYRGAPPRVWSKRLVVYSILIITILCIMMSIDFKPNTSSATLLASLP
ncbi:MAG: heme o synthase [Deltaproteobacteria bacterium]